MKIDKLIIIVSLIVYVILMLFLFPKSQNIYNSLQYTNNIKLPEKIKKNECNITYLSKNSVFTDIKTKKLNNKPKKQKKQNFNTIIVNDNTIIINNNSYTYLGDIKENIKHYYLFITSDKILKLKLKENIPDTNLTLIGDKTKYLIFQDLNKTYIINKNYIDIKKYQKENNETNKTLDTK